MTRRVALGLAVLLALAGCAGSGGADRAVTVTPAPVPTDDPPTPAFRLAPGLAETGVVGPLTLATAHADRLRTTTYHVRIEERIERPDGTVAWRVLTGTFADRTSYVMRVRAGVGNDTTIGSWYYADGERLYERLTIDNETRYYVPRSTLSADSHYPQDPFGHPSQREQLYVALSGANPTYVGSESVAGVEHHRIEASDRVNEDFLAAWEYVTELSDYEFEALVAEDGLVREYRISYVAMVRGEPRRETRAARWTDVGNATVTPPAWYETARERTAG